MDILPNQKNGRIDDVVVLIKVVVSRGSTVL